MGEKLFLTYLKDISPGIKYYALKNSSNEQYGGFSFGHVDCSDCFTTIKKKYPEQFSNAYGVYWFSIHEDYRNNGYGLVLMKRLIEQAEKDNINTIVLGTMLNNKRAVHLYKKCGFQILHKYESGAIVMIRNKKPLD